MARSSWVRRNSSERSFEIERKPMSAPRLAGGAVGRNIELGRVRLAHHLFRAVAIEPARALVPKQDLAVAILADDRVFGRGFEDVGEELERGAGRAHNAAVEQLGGAQALGEGELAGYFLGGE